MITPEQPKRVRITLLGTLNGDEIVIQSNNPQCSRNDHFKLYTQDQDGTRRDIELSVHPENLTYE